jgi:hypothetical protein
MEPTAFCVPQMAVITQMRGGLLLYVQFLHPLLFVGVTFFAVLYAAGSTALTPCILGLLLTNRRQLEIRMHACTCQLIIVLTIITTKYVSDSHNQV